ncbi:YceD family protein [Comamonadaceae bacterium M7527]|nr:YceD family protein [Comamonadaceae bacterium M7527]
MSESSSAPTTIADWAQANVAAWAAQARVDERTVPLSVFTRLLEEAADDVGEAQVQVALRAQERDPSMGTAIGTGADNAKQVWLRIEAQTYLPLTCQRCLQVVAAPLVVAQDLRFVSNEEQAAFEDEEAEEDVLALEPSLDLQALIEDELIMAMPIVPLHEDCQAEGYQAPEPAVDEKPNPFAALAALKKVQ